MLKAMVNNHRLFEMTDEIVPVAFHFVSGRVCVYIAKLYRGGQNNRDTSYSDVTEYDSSSKNTIL